MHRKPDPDVLVLIQLTNACNSFGALPKMGGLLDQDCFFVIGMQLVMQAMHEKANTNDNS